MAVTRSGSAMATRANLLEDCASFGWAADEAAAFIEHARQTLLAQWAEEVQACGFAAQELPVKDPAEWLGS